MGIVLEHPDAGQRREARVSAQRTPVLGTAPVRARADALLDELKGSFRAAEERVGSRCLTRRFGPETVHLRVSGDALTSVLATALAGRPGLDPAEGRARPEPPRPEPLRPEPLRPEPFTVHAFDLVQCGIPLPPLPWGPAQIEARGEVAGFNDEGLRTFCEWDRRWLSLSVVDFVRREGFLMLADAANLPWWQRAAPMSTILHLALGSSTSALTHGAIVGTPDAAAVLAGASGSGKSTTALLCAAAGMRYVADDYFLLDTARAPLAHGLYATAKLLDASRPLLPAVDDFVVWEGSEDEKSVIHMPSAFPEAVVSTLPLTAIVLPRVVPQARTVAQRATAASALRALAPSTILQMVNDGGRALRQLADLARRLPCHTLTLADDGAAPAVIERLLRSGIA